MTNTLPTQTLRRIVRFSINPDGSNSGHNSFAGKPSIHGFAHYYEIRLSINGYPDPNTGYIVGIQEIDSIVRDELVPLISKQIETDPTQHPGLILPMLFATTQSHIKHQLVELSWTLSPYYHLEMTRSTHNSNSILLRQRFEFAAAHRLHSPALSDQENAQYFGKCNNLHGHGHNYQIEPCIEVPLSSLEDKDVQSEIQTVVNSILLDHLDHKFLNIDCEWFDQTRGGVIPSVENITRVCFDQLKDPIAQIAQGIRLVSMTAWETEKTSSIYPPQAP
ncbi:MAG: 6-carboxytetrahydropterin synthase [Phycisphaerales bacterium]|nr:6-carboxytetrahydropterin synthase [Phycisphaerales bacterium]